MKSSTLELLEKLKYDVLDIHYIYSFFSIKMIVGGVEATSMNSPNGYCKLTKLAVGGDKFYINQAVEFGRAGLEFTDVQFRSKSLNFNTN
jgi:hypothetical protein